MHVWGEPRGENFLDSGRHFYEVYKTKGKLKETSVAYILNKFFFVKIEFLKLTVNFLYPLLT